MTWEDKVSEGAISNLQLMELAKEVDAQLIGRLSDNLRGKIRADGTTRTEDAVTVRQLGMELKKKALVALGCTSEKDPSKSIDPALAPKDRQELIDRLRHISDEVCEAQNVRNAEIPDKDDRVFIYGLQEGIKSTFLGLQNDILTAEAYRF